MDFNMVLRLGAAAAAIASATTAAAAPDVSLLCASPGEDSSRSMRVSWHSTSPSCKLVYDIDGEAIVNTAACEKAESPVEYTGMSGYYLYRAELAGLRPGTRYRYRVVCGEESTPSRSFMTAPSDGAFCFLWMGDVHTTPNSPGKVASVDRLASFAEEAACGLGGISFVLFSGDAVKHGQTYSCWKEWDRCHTAAEYMFAAVPGNKEYYRDEGKRRWHDRWFACARNNPPNGAPGIGGSFWFLYGGVLFVGVDTLVEEAEEMSDEVRRTAAARQLTWFEDVAKAQKGRYRYLVVFQHYPYFVKKGPCGYGRYYFWRDAFDRHGVDFALSGDSHSYVRSRRLRGGTECADGTVYVVCPSIDANMAEPSLEVGCGEVAMYDSRSCSYGACWFSVNNDEMTMRYISPDGKVCDSVTAKARPNRANRAIAK